MNREPVTSSNIAAVGYDPATQTMEVEFKNGTAYSYTGVSPEQHKAFVEAPSVGSHFHSQIRNQFPSTKLEPKEAA